MAIYEDSSGKQFSTHAEAAASNTAMGTNPSVKTKSTAIDANTLLENPNPYNIQQPVAPNYGGVDTATNSIIATEKANQQMQVEQAKSDKNDAFQQYLSEIVSSGKIASSVDRTAEDAAKKNVDKYTSMLEQEQLSSRRAIEALQKNNPQGLFGGGLEQEVQRLNRDSLSKQADIAILQTAANRDYATAKEIADRQVQLKTEESKSRLDALKLFYENNKADFDKQDERLYSLKIKEVEREFNKQVADEEKLRDVKIEAVKNGAPISVITKLSQIDTTKEGALDEALGYVGSYLMSPKEKLEMQKLRGDIAKNSLELASAKGVLDGTTGDPVLDVVTASSRYGDKRLTDSQLEKLQKASQALGSMESLQGLLNIKGTGPLTGRARTLVSQIGGDANARAINATIQGLIPTTARGIFGEVGVLTDTDIANYRKTVPNLNSTEEQNRLVSLIMYDVLSRSFDSTLTTNAANQTNVSGFADFYKTNKQRVQVLKSELGITEEEPIDPINKAKMESSWESQNSPTNITNVLNSFLGQ